MESNIYVLILLLWKNFIIHIRQPKQLIAEIVAPILFCTILIIIRMKVYPISHSAQFYTPFKNELPIMAKFNEEINVAWSPENQVLKTIIEETLYSLNTKEHKFISKPFKSRTNLLNYLSDPFILKNTLAGIEFDDFLANSTELSYNINITLRFPGELRVIKYVPVASYVQLQYSWNTNEIFPTYKIAGPRGYDMNTGAEPSYFYEGFLKLEEALSCSIIKHLKKSVFDQNFDCTKLNVYMQRFSYPPWIQDNFLGTSQKFIGLIVLLSFMTNYINIVKFITTEKEDQLKESLSIIGINSRQHWISWFLKSMLMTFLTTTVIVIMFKLKWYNSQNFAILTNSNVVILFLFFTSYSISIVTYCFFISSIFSNANLATSVAGLLWFVNYLPFFLIQNSFSKLDILKTIFVSLFLNSAMGYGFHIITDFEISGEGIQWFNIWHATHPDSEVGLGHIMLLFLFDSLLYLLIAFCIDAVNAKRFLNSLKFVYSLFYINDLKVKKSECINITVEDIIQERPPSDLPLSIQIKNLRKQFSKNNVAIKNISLNIYQNQITVLLGHNGAGKSTLISILSGMLQPTSGTVLINKFNIETDLRKARRSLGVCPQHDILYDHLSVFEHLHFYSILKGVTRNNVDIEIKKYAKLLCLEEKINSMASVLSGGMKRKLAVGLALCGDSKVIILDEPTAGMDPTARRDLWKILISQKEGRTILLTTHYMDEADILGDRIAILSNGQLRCCGSSFFLKKMYGTGYKLIIVKSSNCRVEKITQLLSKYIPSIKVLSDIGSELTFSLYEANESIFEGMFKDLENNSPNLGILSFGLTLTTLEDVFIRACEQFNNTNRGKEYSNLSKSKKNKTNQYLKIIQEITIFKQFLAMTMKITLSHWRSWLLIIIHSVIPILFLIFAVIISNGANYEDLSSLKISLESYKNSITAITFDSNETYLNNYVNNLKNTKTTIKNFGNENLTEIMYDKTYTDAKNVRMHHIVGATFNNDSTLAWFNNEPYHSPPLSLQLVMNSILSKEVSPNYSLQFYNHPLPFGPDTQFARILQTTSIGFQITLNLGLSLTFVSAYYVIFYIRERICKAKHLQLLSGVNILVFWGSAFICDILLYTVTMFGILVTLYIIQFISYEQIGMVFVLLLCFGFAFLPIVYLASFLFKTPATGYTNLVIFNLFTGIGTLLIVQILQAENNDLPTTLHQIFLLFPHYSLTSAFRDISVIRSINKQCNFLLDGCTNLFSKKITFYCKYIICNEMSVCCDTPLNINKLESPGIQRNLIYMCSLGCLLFLLLLLIEYQFIDLLLIKLKRKMFYLPDFNDETEDNDVRTNNLNIRNASIKEINEYSVATRDVTKYYKDLPALKNICLGINKYECFGLLGSNGAGKTTLFKVLVCDLKSSSGNAWINGVSVKKGIRSISKLIGYCSQTNALFEQLTCKETLIIYNLIKGMDFKTSKTNALLLAKQFDLDNYFNRKVETLSIGNKRKLSIALSLIGNPTTIFLDEPTAGMDPIAKRFIWKQISNVRESGKSIIITSHSMEECEALCSRLTIVVNGSLRCLGSTQYIKNKFSTGFTINVKLKKSSSSSEFEQINRFIKENVPNSTLKETHQDFITFYVQDCSIHWSQLFRIMEYTKQYFDVEDYSLKQCSLEQVFLNFTQYQRKEYRN